MVGVYHLGNVVVINSNLICDCNLPVFGAPTLDEAHADGAHPGELVHSLKALVDRLGQQGSKLLVVEDLQVTSWKEQPRHNQKSGHNNCLVLMYLQMYRKYKEEDI